MLKSKKLISLLTSATLLMSLSACSTADKKVSTESASKQTLTVGLMGAIESVPFIIADEKGYFKKQGVDVKLQVFKNSKDRDAAFQSGALDGILGDEIAVSLFQNADFDVKITGITDGNFSLVAGKNSGIKSIDDLKGKSVAISEKTVIEYTLDMILGKKSIDPKDVKKTSVPAMPTRLEMLRGGKVDAALLPEPFSTMAIKDGGTFLGSSKDEGTFPAITAFSQKSINDKSSEIKAFYKAYDEAVEYINSTPISQYEDTVIKTVGYPDDMKGNISLPKFRKNALPSDSELKAVIDWTVSTGLVKKSLTPKDLINDIAVK